MPIPAALLSFWRPYWQRFLARRHPVESGKVRIRHQRLYILPTLYGLGFGMIFITMLVGALNYQLSLGFFFAFLLLGIAHAILLRTYANLLGLQLSCGTPIPVFAGENAYFPLTLLNEKRQPRFGVTIQARQQAESASTHIPGQDHQLLALPVQTRLRGVLALPRLTISSTMPLGFFRCWTYLVLDGVALVYPQPEPDPPPLPDHGTLSDGKKMQASGNEDFAGLREFQRGDALHDIAWKQSARTEQILIRQHQSPIGATLWLNFDELAGLPVEVRLSRLTAWILQAESTQRPYGLALPAQQFPPALGHDHLHRCLSALAQYPGGVT
ncbi:DUF58 domain-containing protein [Chitinibacter sp. FCG-7]|uniref:DUF58 domain-containing protein n=1 Tax=Chitinibacter mangrovi TaxID=3153927 RepID=A0AAU7FBG8_9NEIS